MTKRLIIVTCGLLILFGGIFGYKAYRSSMIADYMANTKPPAVTVSSANVRTEHWLPKIASIGGLSAIQGVDVSTEVPGKVTSINFQSGHQVERGDLLIQLDSTAQQAMLQGLKAEHALAKLDFNRAKGLAQTSAVSQAQLDRAKSQLDSLEAKVSEQDAKVAKRSIRAPFDGELGIRRVNLGEFISPGTEIVTLQNLDPIYVDFTLPERFLRNLWVGQTVEIKVAAFPGAIFNGSISAVSPKVEKTTRNVALQATLPNKARQLRPGMFAQVNVLTAVAKAILTLPRTAITFYPYGDSVYVIDGQAGERTVRRRQVKTGRVRNEHVEILSGLKDGDLVVNTGQNKLRAGQSVKIDNSIKLNKIIDRP